MKGVRTVGRILAGAFSVLVLAGSVAADEDSIEERLAAASPGNGESLSERIVVQQGLTREGWEEVLEYMVEEQGMTPIEEPDRDRVLGYLSTHYGPDRPNFPLR